MGPQHKGIVCQIVKAVRVGERVVAAGDHVDAEFAELADKIVGEPLAARDVLAVGDADVNGMLFDKRGEPLGENSLAQVSEYVADKKDFHRLKLLMGAPLRALHSGRVRLATPSHRKAAMRR